MSFIRLFALPVFQRHYLFHAAVSETTQTTLYAAGARKFQKRISATWTSFETAKKGSLKGWTYRLAQRVLAREDPHETSFKKIPKETEIEKVQVFYPASLKESFVRRNFRILLKRRLFIHRICFGLWSVATLPLMLFMLTPIPNLPLYYGAYRVYSNFVVYRRCVTLLELLHQSQLQRIHVTQHPTLPVSAFNPRVEFMACQTMDKVLKPRERSHGHPIADAEVLKISQEYKLPGLIELVARSRKKVTGAMFPHEFA